MVAANSTLLLPTGYGMTIGLVSQLVLPPNPTRQGLVFVNNSLVVIAICPQIVIQGLLGVYNPAAAGVAAINGPGSINLNPADKFVIDNLACTQGWNGIAAGAGGGITILEHA